MSKPTAKRVVPAEWGRIAVAKAKREFVVSIRLDPSMVVKRYRRRTWRERLLSWPWRPRQKRDWYTAPRDDYQQLGRIVWVHPDRVDVAIAWCKKLGVPYTIGKVASFEQEAA